MDNRQRTIAYQPIDRLMPYPHNARTHTRRQIRQIAESIRAFGFTNPILVDRQNRIVAGHGRVAAAKLLSIDEVPTIPLHELTEEEIRAYVIADNKLCENAGWDKSVLAIELQHLLTLDEPQLDVTVTGFEIPEIDLILGASEDAPDSEDEFPADSSAPQISEDGDLWKLGRHRILCGNALLNDSYTKLMSKHRASVLFADPPYNVKINGHAGGKGLIQHREFAMASGEMSEVEFLSFLQALFEAWCRHTLDGSIHYVCMDWRHLYEVLSAGRCSYTSLLNLCVWAKNGPGLGSLYRSQHEFVLVFRNGEKQHRNNIQLGKFGRNRSNVWRYPGIHTLSKQSEEGNLLALHPTVKPIALVADALLDSSARGGIVLDAFLGSGTTLMAAERVGRICYGMEIDPLYVDIAIRRWQRQTGDHAIHVATGKRFDDKAAEREEAQRA